MKRILLVNTYYLPHYGGIETTLFYIAMNLLRMGYEPVILTSDRGISPGAILPSFERINGIAVHRFPLRRYKGMLNVISIINEYRNAKKAAIRLIQEAPFVGVVVRTHISGIAVYRALKDVPLLYIPPSVVWKQSVPGLVSRSGSTLHHIIRWCNVRLQLPLQIFIQKCLLRNATFVWTFSDVMKSQVSRARGENEISIVQPGIDLERFRPVPALMRTAFRSKHGVAPSELIALCMARLVPQKSFDVAVLAIGELSNDSKWKLWVVGDGPERELLEKIAIQAGVEKKVQFFPATREPEKWYAAADLFLMTSCYEPFGHTLLEAQACGLPIGGFLRDDKLGILNANDEVVRHEETGWIVPYGVTSLAKLLNSLENSSKLQEMRASKQIRQYIEDNFSWNKFCKRLIDEFDRL